MTTTETYTTPELLAGMYTRNLRDMMPPRFRDALTTLRAVTPEHERVVASVHRRIQTWPDWAGLGVAFLGGVGIGKTHMACAMALGIAARGYKVQYYSLPKMCVDIPKSWRDSEAPGLADFISDMQAADLVILDDIGAERKAQFLDDVLYQILDNLYNGMKRTIITSNLTFGQMRATWGDGHGDRLESRICGMCEVIDPEKMPQEDLRKKLQQNGAKR